MEGVPCAPSVDCATGCRWQIGSLTATKRHWIVVTDLVWDGDGFPELIRHTNDEQTNGRRELQSRQSAVTVAVPGQQLLEETQTSSDCVASPQRAPIELSEPEQTLTHNVYDNSYSTPHAARRIINYMFRKKHPLTYSFISP